MKKTILILLFILLFSIPLVAKAEQIECPYKLKSDENVTITTLVTFDENVPENISFETNNSIVNVTYGNNNDTLSLDSGIVKAFSTKGIDTVQDYMNSNGGKCPDFFYVYMTNYGSYYGFYSDKAESNGVNNQTPKYSFISNAA